METERVKLGPPDLIIIVICIPLLIIAPYVPVTITVYVPVTTFVAGVKVKVLVLDVLVGPKTAVTPTGNPDTLNVTALPRLTSFAMPIVAETGFPPGVRATLVIVVFNENPGNKAGVTTRVIDVLLLAFPEIPVILTV